MTLVLCCTIKYTATIAALAGYTWLGELGGT